MGDIRDGEVVEVKGSAAKPYELRNTGGVYSCSCPAWRNQNVPIEQRSCKHLRGLRGDAAEDARILAAGGTPGASGRKTRPKGAAPVVHEDTPEVVDDASDGAPVLLAERWDGVLDPTGWWMSEKLDGVRAYWDGTCLRSRLGNELMAPDWFLEGLPSSALDGELWAGRRQFQRAVSIVRRQDRGEAWREISFVVFDAPTLDAGFEQRLDHCRRILDSTRWPHLSAHDHRRCDGIDALRGELARIEGLGGEGLMLREPGSRYVAGRSTTLLKVKSFRDAEAVVIGHTAGQGRHEGRVGALVVERPGGTRFSVGTGLSDAQRAAPPPIGATITYRYQELTDAGVPRFPSFVGVRDDVRLPRPVSAPPPPTAPRPVTQTQPASTPAAGTRRFEFSDGSSNKFWEVAVAGSDMVVTFGRIGTAGQSKTKAFPSPVTANAEAEKLVAEKTGKGYRPA
jgi:DNA ligase-1